MIRAAKPRTPREVFRAYQQAMLAWDADLLADLYAVDAVHMFPLSSPLGPQRLSGREQIRTYYRLAWGGAPMRIQEIREVAFHVTDNPQVSVAEAEYTAVATATGKTFDLSFVVVMQVENGEIIHLRDYMDYLGAAVGLGRLPALAKALEQQP